MDEKLIVEKPPEPPNKFNNRIIKCKLITILKNKNWLRPIQLRVKIINMVKTEAYFFFNQYIIKLLTSNSDFNFDKNTFERSVLFVLDKYTLIRDKDDEYLRIKKVYDENYKPIKNFKLGLLPNISAVTNPFNYISTEIITNIINHLRLNLNRFQKCYMKNFVDEEFKKYNLSKSILSSILNCILYNTNNKSDSLIIYSDKLKNLEQLEEILPIFKKLIDKFNNEIPEKIRGNTKIGNLKKNYVEILKYYYLMIKYLEDNNKKRFQLLPQLSLKYSYIRFDSRFISTIYDSFMIKEKRVGIKVFEKNYKKYYKRCFNFNKIKYNRNANPISFLTNGYSVCVNFETPIKNKHVNIVANEDIIEKNKINLDEEQKSKKFKRGLYDADNCYATEDFLNKFHTIGDDPGNDKLASTTSETGKTINITKGYYNEISHINKNNNKMKEYIKDCNMFDIYDELSNSCYRKTVKLEIYNKLIEVIRKYWDRIFKFYTLNRINKLDLDTYIYKKKAINKIARKIVPKNGKKHKFTIKSKLLCTENQYDQIIKKPTLIAYGKGNGKMTISNTKNSGPRGPVKTLAKRLSDLTMVVFVDENNTSQICPICQETKVIHPKIIKNNKITSIENYKLCYCNNNNKHPLNMDAHKLWFN
jgi:hypothetical protein